MNKIQTVIATSWAGNYFYSSFKYPTLKTEELKKLPVQEIANNDCLLFMWTSNPHLAQAVALGEAWGFDYKTVAFVWDKMNHNRIELFARNKADGWTAWGLDVFTER